MSATLIGTWLDAALNYARLHEPSSALSHLLRLGKTSDEHGMSQKEAARLLLVNHLRLSRLAPKDIDLDDDSDDERDDYVVEPLRTYRELIRSVIGSKPPTPLRQFEKAAKPDLIIRDNHGNPQAVLEVGYGFTSATVIAAVDRLMRCAWSICARKYADPRIEMVGYLFVHEQTSGEIIRDTVRAIDDWIGAHYGPIHGIDRIALPLMPRLTRSSTISAHGTRLSAIDASGRPVGYVAFCISYHSDSA